MLDVASLKKFDFLKNFSLVAGENGLYRNISNVVILDYEGIDGDFSDFHEGDFIITNLLFAQKAPEKIYSAFEALISIGVCAFAVKTIFFNHLPSDVIELANKHEVPVFLFNDIYIEDVILGITDHIRSATNYSYYETLISAFLDSAPPSAHIDEFLSALIPAKELKLHSLSVSCIYLIPPHEIDEFSLQRQINKLTLQSRHMKTSGSLHILKYKNGILFLKFEPSSPKNSINQIDLYWITIIKELNLSSYTIGMSDKLLDIYKIHIAIARCINASKEALKLNIPVLKYSELGLTNLIYTIIDDEYSREFLDEKLLLLSSDRNRSLSDTMHKLVANDFDIDKTAVALFQHPNTIRYRINKLKELMSVNSDLEFQVLASLYHNLPL